jgi:hypothetical protein
MKSSVGEHAAFPAARAAAFHNGTEKRNFAHKKGLQRKDNSASGCEIKSAYFHRESGRCYFTIMHQFLIVLGNRKTDFR